ncbi:MAG: bifunctional oligoribonuclease/PAP phosphatase NrnA [bacterium]
MEVINKLIKAIINSKNIILLSHVGPDADTLGSMLGLKEILTQLGTVEKIDIIAGGKIPDIYKFLPDINLVKNSNNENLYQSYDLAITVDCGSLDRLGDSLELFRNAKLTANIDHHISNTRFANINWIEPQASACGQILYKLIKPLKVNLTKNIATNFYTAILTDTGGFKFENTKPETLETCAELIRAGANPEYIYKECYESKPLSMVKLQAKAIDQAVFLYDNKIAYTLISRGLIESLNATDDYVDGISEALRQINTVEVALVFKETPKGDTKVSFRSNRINICEIARFFGGGGHKLAAGCTIEKNLMDSVNEILPILKKQINK